MQRRKTEVVSFRTESRGKAAASLTGLAFLILIVAIGQHTPVIAVAVFVGVTLLVAYRNWTAGLFVTTDAVIVRNIFSTRRVRPVRVRTIEFRRGTQRLAQGWGYVFVVDDAGRSRRVTALRRSPRDGDRLAREAIAAVRSLTRLPPQRDEEPHDARGDD